MLSCLASSLTPIAHPSIHSPLLKHNAGGIEGGWVLPLDVTQDLPPRLTQVSGQVARAGRPSQLTLSHSDVLLCITYILLIRLCFSP